MHKQNLEKAGGIAYIAMLIGSSSLIPQIVKVTRLKRADEISLTWLAMGIASSILWVIYALKNNLRAQAIATVIGCIPLITLIVLKHTFSKNSEKFTQTDKESV